MSGPLTDQIERAKLWLGNGYRPVPCLRHDAPATFIRHGKEIKNSPGKRPHPKLWVGDLAKVYNATADSIEGWRNLRNIGTYPNTGLACGWAIGADVDVYEPALAAATEALVLEHLGATPLRRIGQAPKALLLYRAATEPLGKASTAVFANNAGQTAQLEIMGQGQQIVADGTHPCGTPYTWGEQSPDDTPLSVLPAVTQGQVAELIADAETLFLEHGYRPKGIEPPREAAAPSPSPKPHRTADPAGPFRAVNDAAMADLSRWVPQLFGDDAREDRRGGYRVSSAALGRDCEEDISITRDGIVDFGVHDTGDPNLGKRTPIDLVIEHGNAADAVAAAKWLAELTGTPFELPHHVDTCWQDADPHATGRARGKPNGHDDGEAPAQQRAEATAEPAGSRPSEKHARAKGNGRDKAAAVILDPTDPYRSAAVFLERHCSHRDGRTLQRYRGSFYVYTGAHYREMEAEELRRVLYLFLDGAQVWRTAGKKTKGEDPTFELAPFKPNRSHVHDLVDTVQARAGIDDQLAMPCWLGKADPQGAVIPLANGLLEIATRRLHPHSPRYFQSYSLSFDYAPQAPPPAEWLRFLDSLWPDDPEARDTLQEVMGLLLTDDTSHHKLFMLVGPPRSGKGTIARVMQRMHGKENVAGPTLSSLALNFGLQELIGKPVAVISDARLSGRSDAAVIAERLLSISGEDCLTIDRKHRDPWTGTLPTRFLILTNELPRIADSSGALASRFVILMLTKSFLGKEDHQLMTKLTPELSGIFNWALAGRARLEQRGYFVMPTSSLEAVEEIIALSSPIRAFIRDCCVIAPAAEVKVSVLYAQWRAWCGIQGSNRPGTVQAFGTALRAAAAHLKVVQHRGPPDDKLDRYYLGVRLRKEADQCL